MVGKIIIFFAQRLRPCLHSCSVQNLLRLGAPINFNRCATTACAVSPTGSAWQLCSGNPSVATVSIAHSTKKKPPKLGGFILCLCTVYLIQCDDNKIFIELYKKVNHRFSLLNRRYVEKLIKICYYKLVLFRLYNKNEVAKWISKKLDKKLLN